MVLETVNQGKDINVKKLRTEERSRNFSPTFTPPEKLWTTATDFIALNESGTIPDILVRVAIYSSLLFPEKLHELKKFDFLNLNNVTRRVNNDLSGGGQVYFAPQDMLLMRILHPDATPPTLEQHQLDTVKNYIEAQYIHSEFDEIDDTEWVELQTDILATTLLFPELAAEIAQSPDAVQKLTSKAERWKELGDFGKYAIVASASKLLFADQPRLIIPSQNDWENMNNTLQTDLKDPAFIDAVQFAGSMMLLAAESIKLTDKGIELTMPAPVVQVESNVIPPEPTERNF